MTNAEKMLAFAREQLGELYYHGHHGMDTWDCSGLTMEMVELMGLEWKHSSHWQWLEGIRKSGDFSEYGEIDTLPTDRFAFLFKYGNLSSGNGKGMIHVGVYDGAGHQIQAGGNGKKVTLPDGTRKSTVSEDEFTPSYWTHWAHVKGQDNEVDKVVEESGYPTLGYEKPPAPVREYVKTLQNLLNQRGEDLDVDGKFGKNTESAVKAFQALHGIEVTGKADQPTWAALLAEENMKETYTVQVSNLSADEADDLVRLYYPDAAIVK